MSFYCVRERIKVEGKDVQRIKLANGRAALQGVCENCGTRVFRMQRSLYMPDPPPSLYDWEQDGGLA